MKKVFLITVPSSDGKTPADVFVTDDLNLITGKYSVFMIQQVNFITDGVQYSGVPAS